MAGRGGIAIGVVGALLALAGSALAATAQTQRVSVTPAAQEPNGESYEPSVSSDGRFVVFSSRADDIVPGVSGAQIYVYDRTNGQTQLVSESSSGDSGNKFSYEPVISADGRYVAFASAATNLVPNDTNHVYTDVFVRDLKTGTTTQASVSSNGAQGDDYSAHPAISADGSVVAFSSDAKNLTSVKTASRRNEFVRDLATGKTVQVNVTPKGQGGNGDCHSPSISANGRLVAFESKGKNLVKGGSKGWNIFVRDLKTGKTVLASQSSGRRQGNGSSFHPSISGDGRFVAFESKATNLVKRDTNKAFDVFERDLVKGKTVRVSVSAKGKQANGASRDASVSKHGGFVAYQSAASNLVPGSGGPSTPHVYLYSSRGSTQTAVIDLGNDGAPANTGSEVPSISADGRFAAFASDATNLVSGASAGTTDVYIRGPLR